MCHLAFTIVVMIGSLKWIEVPVAMGSIPGKLFSPYLMPKKSFDFNHLNNCLN